MLVITTRLLLADRASCRGNCKVMTHTQSLGGTAPHIVQCFPQFTTSRGGLGVVVGGTERNWRAKSSIPGVLLTLTRCGFPVAEEAVALFHPGLVGSNRVRQAGSRYSVSVLPFLCRDACTKTSSGVGLDQRSSPFNFNIHCFFPPARQRLSAR